jgi:hypothetical protein
MSGPEDWFESAAASPPSEVIDPFKKPDDDTPRPLSESIKKRKAEQQAAGTDEPQDLADMPDQPWGNEEPETLM